MEIHSETDFEIKYIKGKENSNVDALSRRVQINHLANISSYRIDLEEQIKNAKQHDEKYQHIKEKLQEVDESEKNEKYHLIRDDLSDLRTKSMCQIKVTWRNSY